MPIKNIGIFFGIIVSLLLNNVSYAYPHLPDSYRVLYYLDGYKCMLADTNQKDIPNFPSPELYETPDKNAQVIGKADLTSLVNTRILQINGRQAILRPD